MASTAATAVEGAQEHLIACNLEVGRLPGRWEDWSAVVGRASARRPLPGGVALTFDHDPELTVELARLVAAEQACCPFFDFRLVVTPAGVRFEVRAPGEAQQIVAAMFGEPGPASAPSSALDPSSHPTPQRSPE